MSEENKVVEPQNQQAETTTETVEVEKAKETLFNQDQVNNIVQQRLDAEKKKQQRIVE